MVYGLEAINQHNGWDIAVVGITIVFSGLVLLSLVLSQLHKALDLWENPSKIKKMFKRKEARETSLKEIEAQAAIDALTEAQKQAMRQFFLLARTLEDHFSLPRLLYLAKISGLSKPYSNLNNLLKTMVIVPDTEGNFIWDKKMYDRAVSA